VRLEGWWATLEVATKARLGLGRSLFTPTCQDDVEEVRYVEEARMVSVYLNAQISGIPGYAHSPTDTFPDTRLRIREFPDKPKHC